MKIKNKKEIVYGWLRQRVGRLIITDGIEECQESIDKLINLYPEDNPLKIQRAAADILGIKRNHHGSILIGKMTETDRQNIEALISFLRGRKKRMLEALLKNET